MKGFPVLRRLEDNDKYHQSIDLAYQIHEGGQGILENRDHGQDHLGKNHMFGNYLSRNFDIVRQMENVNNNVLPWIVEVMETY